MRVDTAMLCTAIMCKPLPDDGPSRFQRRRARTADPGAHLRPAGGAPLGGSHRGARRASRPAPQRRAPASGAAPGGRPGRAAPRTGRQGSSQRSLVGGRRRPSRGERPTAYADLAGWLARAIPAGRGRLREVERTGREIGLELAPEDAGDPVEAFRQTIAALGFQPVLDVGADGGFACRLENCPYRDSVRQNPDVVCTLHRGITAGLLAELDPEAKLTRFEPHDPERAGCLIEVVGAGSR